MKKNLTTCIVAGTMFMLAALDTQAQSREPASMPAASATPDAKAMKAANRALQKDVLRALSRTKGLRNSTITVRANNGVVTLEGTVPEQSQVEMATHATEGVTGVTAVRNALTLSSF